MAGPPGFEPGVTGPKPDALPFGYGPTGGQKVYFPEDKMSNLMDFGGEERQRQLRKNGNHGLLR